MGIKGKRLEHHGDVPAGNRCLGKIPTIDLEPAFLRTLQTGDGPQGGCLAHGTRAEDNEKPAPFDLEGHPVQGNDTSETFGDGLQADSDVR